MAAKPPKPPGNFLKENNAHKNITALTTTTKTDNINENNIDNCSSNTLEKEEEEEVTSNAAAAKSNCNCTNISIMHLFHEMKQEFPTIPDTIVAQCVNENCHQRENCIQMLRKELALNPIPVQAYPAKVLYEYQQQRQNFNNNKPARPLKPTRVAPQNPAAAITAVKEKKKLFSPLKKSSFNNNNKISNCDSFSEVLNNTSDDHADLINRSDIAVTKPVQVNRVNNNNVNCNGNKSVHSEIDNNSTTANANGQPNSPIPQPRARPTTLNLQSSQTEQQQRQQLHVQLQQHLQQRNNCKQTQQQHPPILQKPLRKAPLPPQLPPKPTQYQTTQPPPLPPQKNPHTFTSQTNANLNSIQQQLEHSNSQQSFSSDTATSTLTSPTSSIGGNGNGESEISVNVSLISPIIKQQQQQQQHPQLKSPIRHRSVITVKPEPPYTRDFLAETTAPVTTPTTQTSSPQTSGGTLFSSNINSPKSFTSVNLTLRQPNINSAIPQSTIDISAGPGLSGGQTSGLTYSSTSYDARRGFQKNFHITVTDEGGVFSASRIRPLGNQFPADGDHEGQDVSAAGNGNDGSGSVSPLQATAIEQNYLQQHKQQNQYNSQSELQQQQQQIVANNNSNIPRNNKIMCHPREISGFPEIIQRQKERRDKLATAVRDKKKRLSQIEQEINLLTEPIQAGQAVSLDNDLQRLRCDCQAMWSEVENARRSSGPPIITYNQSNQLTYNYQPLQQQQQQPLQQPPNQLPQPFPRQRPPRPPQPQLPLGIVRQPHLDFVQHHINNNASTMQTNTAELLTSPPSYEQQQQQYFPNTLTDDEDYSDSNNTDTGGEDEEDYWACNMCTFRNHPQLNICECCENVRILPGTIRIVPTSAAAVAAAAAAVNAVAPVAPTSAAPATQTAATATATVP